MSFINLASRHRLLLLVVVIALVIVFGGLTTLVLADGGTVEPDGCTLPEPSNPDRCST